MNRVKSLLTCCALCGVMAGWIQPAFGQIDIVLPIPGDGTSAVYGTYNDATGSPRDAILMDGIPIAFKYDDAWSYSLPLLTDLQAAGFVPYSYGDYANALGVGSQDVVLFTQAKGQDNNPVGVGDCCILEEPGPTTSNNTIKYVESWWGQDDQNNDGTYDTDDGPNTVGEVLAFLNSFNPNQNVPVFVVDWNQTGGGDSLLVSANILIIDATYGTTVEDWSLDTTTNGSFDRLDQALNLGQICFSPTDDRTGCKTGDIWAGETDSGRTYSVTHNVGSGKGDFAIFAPTMDLSLYDPNDLFVFHLVLGCLDEIGLPYPDGSTGLGCATNGAEEGFMTGRISTSGVPEPATLALLGLGLVGFGFRRWKAS